MPSPDPVEPSHAPASADRIGGTIGSYRLLKVLGSGGMGTVYLAEHVRIGRQVALKLLRPEVKDRRQGMQRLAAEARALGRVSHPGVVTILDLASLADGTPYLVMEYLPGRSLRAHLREERAQLGLETILLILYQATQAMAAAHAAGVVHRDLSPANIMLSPKEASDWPQIKILDFGLARLSNLDGVSDSSLSTTRDGAVLGTLKYMAPEQCLDPHSVDARADVYALGVIGYELCAGQPPFSAASAWELIELHLREPPPPLPPTLADGKTPLPEELSKLLLEMLSKSPLSRPEMSEIAARLSTLLPRASSASTSISAPIMRMPRRRRTFLLPALAAVSGVLSMLLVALGLYAHKQHLLAELRRRETLAAAGEMLRVINGQLRPIPGAASASHALLGTTKNLLDRLNAQSPADLDVLEATARLYTLRGEISRHHAGLPDARRDFERAIALSETLIAAQPQSAAYKARLASAYEGLADVLEQLSELPLAKANYEKALALRLAALQNSPDDPVRVQDAVGSYLLHGDLLRTQGLFGRALADYEQAQRLLEPVWKRDPDKKNYRWQMCGVLYRLGQMLLTTGKLADGLVHVERAVELLSRIAPTDQQGASYHLLLARVLQMRGDVRDRLGHDTEAEHDYSQSLDIVRGLLHASPSDVQLRRAFIDSSYKAIDHWLRLGKIDRAETLANQLEATAQQLLLADATNQGHKWRLAGSLQRIGDVALARRRPDEARRIYQRALEIQESMHSQNPEYSRHRDRTAWLLERLGEAAARGRFPAQALPFWAQALGLLENLERVDSSSIEMRLAKARILRKRGTLRYGLLQKADALGDWESAVKLAEGLVALDGADAAAQRELILIEFARVSALAATPDGKLSLPAFRQRLALARERLATLRQQGLYPSDVALSELERAAAQASPPIR